MVLALVGDFLSKNCARRLLLPTEVFPIMGSLQSMVEIMAAIDEDEEVVTENENANPVLFVLYHSAL